MNPSHQVEDCCVAGQLNPMLFSKRFVIFIFGVSELFQADPLDIFFDICSPLCLENSRPSCLNAVKVWNGSIICMRLDVNEELRFISTLAQL
jgi:hypothetical protein